MNPSNPLVQKIVGTVIRNLVMPAVAWLVARHLFPEDQSAELVSGLTLLLTNAVWGIWEKFHSQKKLVTAMASGPTSEVAVKAAIKAGLAPPVTTPPTEVPELKNIVVP